MGNSFVVLYCAPFQYSLCLNCLCWPPGHQDIVDYGGTSQDGDGAYGGMTNFGNLLTITYLSTVSPGHGSTRLAPRSHRTDGGLEGPGAGGACWCW